MMYVVAIRNHRRSILFTFLVLGTAGFVSTFGLPVSLFPQVTFPRVVVSVDSGDRPAERMAIEATLPLEEAVRSVPGVQTVRSTTSRGSAEISINFDWSEDMVSAMLQVESALNRTRDRIPSGSTFEVRRMDPTVFPVLGYSLTSATKSLVELRDIALYQLRPALSTIPGVATIGILGGEEQEYHIFVDPVRLNAFGLELNDVADALSSSNVVTAVGRIEENNRLYLVVSNTSFDDQEQIGLTVLKSAKGGIVSLSDVAEIETGTVPQWIRVNADGQDAVLFQVYQQPDGNTVRIAGNVDEELKSLATHIPSDVKIANWYDQSELILSSATSVFDAVLIGSALASVILLVFLRNLKVTLITALCVPAVLAITSLALFSLNKSFNIMTLGGLAAAVGLIIDDAIVMVEHAIRRCRNSARDFRGSIVEAATEITTPLIGSSLSTIVIFAPLAFLTGVTGAFFHDLSLTMAISLFVSFLIAWLAVPSLCMLFLGQRDAEREDCGPITSFFQSAYSSLIRFLLAHPWFVFLLILPLLIVGGLSYQKLGSGFMPPMDEGGFVLDYRSPAGTSLSETDRLVRELEDILQQTPEVQTYSRRTGLQLGGGLSEANEGDFFVRLNAGPRRDVETVIDDVRGQIEHSIPGLSVEMLQLMEDLVGDLSAVPQPIEVKLFSDDKPLLESLAEKVATAIGDTPGVVDINPGVVLAGDAVEVGVDRNIASLERITPEEVTRKVEDFLSGIETTEIEQDPKMVGIRLWVREGSRKTMQDLKHLQIRSDDGHLLPLDRVATLRIVTGQSQITREDLKQMVAVTARISGRDMGSTVKDVRRVLDKPGFLPPGVYYRLGGLYEQQRIAFAGLLVVLASAVTLVFLLLLVLYESFRVSISMLLNTLLALSAVFVGLWMTGTEINITAIMGMTMVVGIVTEVSILYYSEFHGLAVQVPLREGLVLAGQNRMRPIAMTTSAAILALLPLALGTGQGAAMQRPLAIAIISGLVVQLPLVLFVLPSFLVLLHAIPQKDASGK